MKFSKEKYLLTLIFLFAFIIRLVFVLGSNDMPSSDASVYDKLALSISQNKGYINKDGTAHSWYPPFYPFFLSVIYRLFGHSYTAVRVIQSILGASSCLLIYLIGKRVCGIAVARVAGFVSIVYFPFIKSAELLLTELVFMVLLLLIVRYVLKIQKDARFKNCVILGLLLGVALLTKYIMSLFPLFIVFVFIYLKREHPTYNLKKYTIVLLFFILSISPWIIRNWNVYHKFVPVSPHTGIAFYTSFRPPGGIFGFIATKDDPVVREAYNIPSLSLRSNFLIKKTLDFIVNNPKEVLVLELKKILYLWAPFDWEIVGGRWFNLLYVVMLPFFIWGVFLTFKDFGRFLPILLPIIYFQVMTLVFYGSPRFRLPIEPYIFILSTMGILECWGRIFKIDFRRGGFR